MKITKLIILMKNGDRYELNSNKDFDSRNNLTIKEMISYISREISDGSKIVTFYKEGYDIKYVSYVSRFTMYIVDQLTISVDDISSLQLLEGFQNNY